MLLPENGDLPANGLRLRVYVGESDTLGGKAVYRIIVEEARRRNMAGATVTRGIMGFGAASRIHTTRVLRLSEDLPVVVEVIDTTERIEAFIEFVDSSVGEGLVTTDPVRIRTYRHQQSHSSSQ